MRAEHGDAEACMLLAEEILDANNPDSIAEGVRWYRKALRLGQHHDPLTLGIDLPDVPVLDPSQGQIGRRIDYHWRRAEKGKIKHQFHLGCLFAYGGTDQPPDFAEAYAWFHVAARRLQGEKLQDLQTTVTGQDWPEVQAARSARLIAMVLEGEDLTKAKELASRYLKDFGSPSLLERTGDCFQDWGGRTVVSRLAKQRTRKVGLAILPFVALVALVVWLSWDYLVAWDWGYLSSIALVIVFLAFVVMTWKSFLSASK